MTRPPRDLGASVQARLRNIAKQRGDDVQHVLTLFALERLLVRIGASPHHHQFVLKGALLFFAWTGVPHRATRDLDLLGHGSADEARLAAVFEDVCTVPVEPDGASFDPESVVMSRIREGQSYEGWRAVLSAAVGTARIQVQIDIGFGDAVLPSPELLRLPTLLDMPAPTILAYPRETVVAEKFEAMVSLGLLNSRMKDFFDLRHLALTFSFEGDVLAQAMRATFTRRQTQLPTEPPVALTNVFAADSSKQTQWRAFLNRTKLDTTIALDEVVTLLHAFLWPVVAQPSSGDSPGTWPAGGPWVQAG